jgi:hypothetical protein
MDMKMRNTILGVLVFVSVVVVFSIFPKSVLACTNWGDPVCNDSGPDCGYACYDWTHSCNDGLVMSQMSL